jgi:peptidoglycan/xylan/chitin deacetylase (PgdA/CDA1 family)
MQINTTKSNIFISFVFDDGLSSIYDIVFPFFENCGIVGDIALVGSYVNKSGYLNSEQIKELISKGWSLGDHTFTHPDMNRLPLERLSKEVELNQDFVKKAFDYEFSYFVFPKSRVKVNHLSFVLNKYCCAFTGESKIVSNTPPFRGLLKRTQISIYEMVKFFILRRNFFKELLQEISLAASSPNYSWFILFTHNVSKMPSVFDTPWSHFNRLVQQLMEMNVKITSANRVLSKDKLDW